MKLLLIVIGLTGCASTAAAPTAPVEHEPARPVAGVLASSSGEQVTIDQALGWVHYDDTEGWAWPTIVLLGGGSQLLTCAEVLESDHLPDLAPVAVVAQEADLEEDDPTQVDQWVMGGVDLQGPIQPPSEPVSAQVTIHERRGDRWTLSLDLRTTDPETGADRPLASGRFDMVWCGDITAP